MDLGQSAARGVFVTLLAKWGNTITMLASSVVLARLLSPNDFGIVAMVTVVIGFTVLFQDLGLTSAVVRAKDLTNSQQTSIWLMNILLGLVLTLTMFALAPLIASFYNQPEVENVARVLSLTFLISSFSGQSRADLLRSLRFSVLGGTQVAVGLVQLVVAIVLAVKGFGYWAIVTSSVVSSVLWALTLILRSNFRPSRPAPLREVGILVKQGLQITFIQSATFLSRSMDVIAVGRFYGADTVGLYNRASQVVGIVEQQLTSAMTAVALPVLSKLQDSPDRFQKAVNQAVNAIGYTLTPIFTSLSLAAVPAVTFVYGEQWRFAGQLLVIIALAGTVRSVLLLFELSATALGAMSRQISGTLIAQSVAAAVLIAAATVSVETVAIGYVAVTYISVVFNIWWISRGTYLSFRSVMISFARPLVVWIFAYIVAVLVREFLVGGDLFLASVSVGVQFATGLLIILLLPAARRDVRDVFRLFRRAVSMRA
ncbi:lipopolysaccharide biosynthesis protein [Rhodococcus sp. SBT000017]|uniref:lipopolysaccharide biosynthesis protein n=1 Tax=Rhodococcus sp. SBT000017 TaxID=1803385 RepID=UPI00217EE33F|nr:lipopolysaccharide biosynthesis protein [Rhodococcus sp. SBT000017]